MIKNCFDNKYFILSTILYGFKKTIDSNRNIIYESNGTQYVISKSREKKLKKLGFKNGKFDHNHEYLTLDKLYYESKYDVNLLIVCRYFMLQNIFNGYVKYDYANFDKFYKILVLSLHESSITDFEDKTIYKVGCMGSKFGSLYLKNYCFNALVKKNQIYYALKLVSQHKNNAKFIKNFKNELQNPEDIKMVKNILKTFTTPYVIVNRYISYVKYIQNNTVVKCSSSIHEYISRNYKFDIVLREVDNGHSGMYDRYILKYFGCSENIRNLPIIPGYKYDEYASILPLLYLLYTNKIPDLDMFILPLYFNDAYRRSSKFLMRYLYNYTLNKFPDEKFIINIMYLLLN